MGYLYRFRRNTDDSFDAFSNLSIEGSIYAAMKDKNEVLLEIDVDRLCKITTIDRSIVEKTCDIIRNHILNHYFIACFAKTDQLGDLDMWKEYSNGDGFCLVYNEASITNAICFSMMKHKDIFHMFRDVDYGFKPTDITLFVEDYLRIVGKDVQNEEAHKNASNKVGDSFSRDIKQKITNAYFHKIGTFPEKSEKRIVSFNKNSKGPFSKDLLLEKVKPILIIYSDKMPTDSVKRLKSIAKKNSIRVQVHHLK